MSAIFGLLRFDGGPALQETLDRLAAPLAFMGRDGTATTLAGPLGLGHHRMAVDVSGRPPDGLAVDEGRGLRVTADARLDNRGELAEALALDPDEVAGLSDSALILRAYGKWGDDCAEHLLGDFAFAVFDAGRGRLLCGRDHFGARPFYYHRGGGAFLFASAVPALFAAGGPSRELDPQGVACYLLLNGYADDLTLYRDIRALPSGTVVSVGRDGAVRGARYWRVAPVAAPARSDADWIEGFRERLRTAVHARLPGSGPVAATISGGLDSSVVAAVATRLMGGRRLVGVANLERDGDAEFSTDDWRHAQALADFLPALELHYVSTAGRLPTDGQQEFFDIQGSPLRNPLRYGWDALLAEAARHGCRVMLTGLEGDWGVSGPGDGYLSELFRRGEWRRGLAELRAARARQGNVGLARMFVREVIKPMIPPWAWDRVVVPLTGRPTWTEFRPVGRWLAQEIDLPRFMTAVGYYECWHKGPSLGRNERGMLSAFARWRQLEHYPAEFARFGLAPAFPLMDVRLVEHYLAMPPRLKFSDGMGRQAMRRAAEGWIPDAIRLRPTKGPFVPDMLHALWACWPEIDGTLRRAATEAALARYVDFAKVLAFVDRAAPQGPRDFRHVAFYDLVLPAYYLVKALRAEGPASGPGSRPGAASSRPPRDLSGA